MNYADFVRLRDAATAAASRGDLDLAARLAADALVVLEALAVAAALSADSG